MHSIIPSRRNSITKKVRVGVKGLADSNSHIELTISSSPSTSLKSIHMTATMTIFKGNTNNRTSVWSEDRKEVPRRERSNEVAAVIITLNRLANIDMKLRGTINFTEAKAHILKVLAVNRVPYTPAGTTTKVNSRINRSSNSTTVKNKISYSREVAG